MTIEILRRDGDDACSARQINPEQRTIRFLAQSTKMASDNLIILAHAGKKLAKKYMRNPIVVPYHRLSAFDDVTPVVVGNVVEDEFLPDGRYQTVRFATTVLAEQWWHLYAVDKVMRMVSIAWYRRGEVRVEDPKKMINLLTKHKLGLAPDKLNSLRGIVTEYGQRDLSLVPIGADPDAMQHSADGGNDVAQHMMRGFEHSGGVWVPRKAEFRVPGAELESEGERATDDKSGGETFYDGVADQVVDKIMPQVREIINDAIEPFADQIEELLGGASPPEMDMTEHDETAEGGERGEAGQPGDAGTADANADGTPNAPAIESPYGDLLDMSRDLDGRGRKVIPFPTDLVRQATGLAQDGQKPEEE